MESREFTEKKAKSPIKWVGGKKRLATEIISHFPKEFGRYFEPFAGGASVFFEAAPRDARISDLNPNLIGFYLSLRDQPLELMRQAKSLENEFNALDSAASQKNFYLEQRAVFNATKTSGSVSVAALFLFLNKTSFNGLYRENRDGLFNVPFNNTSKLNLFEEAAFLQNSKTLKRAEIIHGNFVEATREVSSGDLVYFDPPYIPISNTASFTSYTKSSFGPDSQVALRDHALTLVARGAHVILSNSFSEDVKELYANFELHELDINRLIAAKGSSRGSIKEYLILGRPSGN